VKLVSDFDGVWTLPDDEARAQGEVLDGLLAGWLDDRTPERAAAWIRGAREAALAEPRRHGWAPDGRISAFADEDPFAAHSALLHAIHLRAEDGDATARRLRDAARSAFEGLDRLGGHSHAEGVKQVAATRGPGVLSGAAGAGRRLLEKGRDVVVVSNSGTDKLARWFEYAGLASTVHPERRAGALRLRGNARKFVLDPAGTDLLDLGGFSVETARPSYEAILRDETPDAVVGDVFSLDLSLPLVLRRREKAFAGMRLFWLMRPYTPGWLRQAVAAAMPGEVEPIEGGLEAVAEALLGRPQRKS
jgi:hypothetical protein